jgi:hypothetical protein
MTTTSSPLVRVSTELVEARRTVADALRFVNSISSEDEANLAYDQVKLAREWAKIRRISDQMHLELLRLEVHCLRKIAQLGSITIIDRKQRPAATYFRDMSDEAIETLLQDFGQGVTPWGLMQRAVNSGEKKRGQEHVNNGNYALPTDEYAEPEMDEAVKRYALDTKAAIASILTDYEVMGDEFTIYDLSQEMFARIGVDTAGLSWGMAEAMDQVCRKAVSNAADLVIAGTKVPKFITCLYRAASTGIGQKGQYIRVPFHTANMQQLNDMVTLRREQVDSAQRALDRVEAVQEELAATRNHKDGSSAIHFELIPLGELAMRVPRASRRPDVTVSDDALRAAADAAESIVPPRAKRDVA